MEAVFRPRMPWVPSKALWDRKVSELIGLCSDVKRVPSSTEKGRWGIPSLRLTTENAQAGQEAQESDGSRQRHARGSWGGTQEK
jgi:hypothetical protein